MRVIIDLRTDQAENAIRLLADHGFVIDANFPAPRPHDADPSRCSVVGEVPIRNLDKLQLQGVITWHVAEMAP